MEEIDDRQISKSPRFPAAHDGARCPRRRVCGLRGK
jgi:hypothetical protein